jgi:HEAT repeat protein
LRSLALVFASVEAADSDLPGYVIERLLGRVARSNGSVTGAYGRPNWIAAAAEIAARARSCPTRYAEAIVAMTESECRRDGALGREQAPVVNALADLKIARAYEALWKYATEGHDYSIRRAAIKALSRGGARAVEALIPIIADVMENAEQYAASLARPSADDRGEPFDGLKAVGWMLPSLRSVAGLGALDRRLGSYQDRLLSYASTLSTQRGLEAAIAQGLKLDAMQKPFLPNDPLALQLLGPGPSRARFWYSRVLLLQALTIRYPYDRTPDALELISAGQSDHHVFVREVAQRCLRALEGGGPSSLLFEDLIDATSRAPHGEDMLTVQLIGDIVLSLNLNEYGSPAAREAFGTENRLPACIGKSQDRREVLMYLAPLPECPFARHQSGACLCPYTYDAPEPANRRELSRAFCRHLRLHARRSPWQSDISVKDLKGFWRGMENLAQF